MSDTNETIAEILRLDEEATPGPWYDYHGPEGGDVEVLVDLPEAWAADLPEELCPWRWDARPICTLEARPDTFRPGMPHGQRVTDATLIAYYRTAAPALAREVQRLQAECIDLHSALDLSCEREARAYLRGQEAMRERCIQACEDIILFSRSAEGIHLAADMRCMRSHLLQAIRALEVE